MSDPVIQSMLALCAGGVLLFAIGLVQEHRWARRDRKQAEANWRATHPAE